MKYFSRSIKLLTIWIIFLIIPIGGFPLTFRGISMAQQNDHIQTYWGSFASFKKKLCQPTDKETFDKLYKEYKGAGYYIPTYQDVLVKESLKAAMPLLDKKILWIQKLKSEVEKLVDLPVINDEITELNTIIDENTKLRYQNDLGKAADKKDETKAKEQVESFKKKYNIFLEKVFYLKNIDFPVDHYLNRLTYDRLAAKPIPTTPSGVVPAIVIEKLTLYLKRKFYEDGAMDPDVTKNDVFLRTLIDTFTIELSKIQDYFTPEIIRDWEWISKNLQNMRARGAAQQKLRLAEWLSRTQATKQFYDDLMSKNKTSQNLFLSELSAASDNLKSFVEFKLSKVYEFWMNQSEAVRNLFVLETILMHEVGTVDPVGDDRKDVVKVVLNRVNNDAYHFLHKSDPWETLLGQPLRDKKYWWLNVLYRKGEFSFMHFFMNSSYKVFCPDETPVIKSLRESNLKLALEVLRTYEPGGFDSNIYRYFSRISMLGRIDMTQVWSPPYELVEETPGTRLDSVEETKIIKLWKLGGWRYLYSFNNNVKKYAIFEIDNKTWTFLWDNGEPTQVYSYRDRDYFKFFRLP